MKNFKKIISENMYVFLGILIGLYISTFFNTNLETTCHYAISDKLADNVIITNKTAQEIIDNSVNRLAPKLTVKKSVSDTSNNKKAKLVRPRYYSTELGIREKMFVGIFTSEEKVNTQAVHINKTIGHIVDRIKFFITAQYKLKTKFNLTGLVGFTDGRTRYRPFQVVKYVGDTFAQDYDYYFFTNDYSFINIHRLKDIVNNISVSMDVYLGTKVPDASYCNLDAGILLSNSVLKAMRNRLEWCIMNSVSDDYSENLGRCVHHSLGLSCQESVQGQEIKSFKLKHFDLAEHLFGMSHNEEFNQATLMYPILQKNDFYMLNAYFLKQRLSSLNTKIKQYSEFLTDSWPPGQRKGAKPATRFDLPKQYYFNMSHIFFPDDFTTLRKHSQPELLDIENIVNEVTSEVAQKYPKEYAFRRLVNGYKMFDLSRGMDYILDLGFRDLKTGKEIIKRFEVCKPLGNVEFIQVPYVTENTRVTILLPIEEDQITLAINFLTGYSQTIMDRKEKTFLMLVFLYQYNSSSKGLDDVFLKIKDYITRATSKYKNDDVKMGWVSIRLPESDRYVKYDENKALNFAIIDLALKKIGLDSLVLFLDLYCNITVDFLNRVRMNTIVNYQIFSPIPFRQYDPRISQYDSLEVNKNAGHFDRQEYRYLSFYGRDYVTARKKYQQIVPLIRIDNDITQLMEEKFRNLGNVFEMFVKTSASDLHCMRATEMNLKIVYHEERDGRKCKFLGNEGQLGKLLIGERESIPELL